MRGASTFRPPSRVAVLLSRSGVVPYHVYIL